MNPQPVPENIIAKIQKLMALGQSPNEAEAALAMAFAQSLLAKYNLDCATVTEANVSGGVNPTNEKREETKISRSAMFEWQRQLWRAVAEANFCWYSTTHVYEGKRGAAGLSKRPVKRHMVLGRQANVMAVRIMGEYLEDTIEKLLPFPNQERMSRSAQSWKSGCTVRLSERIAIQAEERKSQSEADIRSTGTGTGLVLRSVYQSEYAANYDSRYGSGAYAKRLVRNAEWDISRDQRRAAESALADQKEAEWNEFLKNETPAQCARREAKEAKEKENEQRKQNRSDASYWARRDREESKIDRESYAQGACVAETIGLSTQLPTAANRKGIA